MLHMHMHPLQGLQRLQIRYFSLAGKRQRPKVRTDRSWEAAGYCSWVRPSPLPPPAPVPAGPPLQHRALIALLFNARICLTCRLQLKEQLGEEAAAGRVWVFSSPFSRTMETAQLATSQLGTQLEIRVRHTAQTLKQGPHHATINVHTQSWPPQPAGHPAGAPGKAYSTGSFTRQNARPVLLLVRRLQAAAGQGDFSLFLLRHARTLVSAGSKSMGREEFLFLYNY